MACHAQAVLERGGRISVVKDPSSMKNVLHDMKYWLTVAIEAEQSTEYLRTEFTGLWMLWANVSGSSRNR